MTDELAAVKKKDIEKGEKIVKVLNEKFGRLLFELENELLKVEQKVERFDEDSFEENTRQKIEIIKNYFDKTKESIQFFKEQTETLKKTVDKKCQNRELKKEIKTLKTKSKEYSVKLEDEIGQLKIRK